MTVKSVKINANSSNKNWPTINISTTKLANTTTHAQLTGAVGKHIQQFQEANSGKITPGFKTIHIPGYSGPG